MYNFIVHTKFWRKELEWIPQLSANLVFLQHTSNVKNVIIKNHVDDVKDYHCRNFLHFIALFICLFFANWDSPYIGIIYWYKRNKTKYKYPQECEKVYPKSEHKKYFFFNLLTTSLWFFSLFFFFKNISLLLTFFFFYYKNTFINSYHLVLLVVHAIFM